MRLHKRKAWLVIICAVLLLFIWFSIPPSNDRDWSEDQRVLPYAEFNGDEVHIHNIRNFNYRSTDDYDVAYYDKTYNLDAIKSAWYVVEPFSEWEGAAHTFLSFGFEGPEYVAISIEIRKEQGEEFSSLKGLFKRYELMYVIGDERDLIKLRSNYRKDDVFLYPVVSSKDTIRKLFVDMLQRTNDLREKPEFYNTVTNTCTTNIMSHINSISPKRMPFDLRVLTPGFSDRLVYELGLVDTTLPFEEVRAHFQINERAMQYANSPNFSQRIREFD